jgi:hypothetical protein
VFRCLGIQVFRCSGIQVFKCRALLGRLQGIQDVGLDTNVFKYQDDRKFYLYLPRERREVNLSVGDFNFYPLRSLVLSFHVRWLPRIAL